MIQQHKPDKPNIGRPLDIQPTTFSSKATAIPAIVYQDPSQTNVAESFHFPSIAVSSNTIENIDTSFPRPYKSAGAASNTKRTKMLSKSDSKAKSTGFLEMNARGSFEEPHANDLGVDIIDSEDRYMVDSSHMSGLMSHEVIEEPVNKSSSDDMQINDGNSVIDAITRANGLQGPDLRSDVDAEDEALWRLLNTNNNFPKTPTGSTSSRLSLAWKEKECSTFWSVK